MLDSKHLTLLTGDVDEWNRWRATEPGVMPLLVGARLNFSSLVLANLSRAKLCDADLSMADLTGADLSDADLQRANLVGTRLIGVDLCGADLRGADLRTAEDLTDEQLAEARGDHTTRLPDGMRRPTAWPDGASATVA